MAEKARKKPASTSRNERVLVPLSQEERRGLEALKLFYGETFSAILRRLIRQECFRVAQLSGGVSGISEIRDILLKKQEKKKK